MANFSKVFGYIFDATPPTEILDTRTKTVMSVNSAEIKTLMQENDAPTIERLIEKMPHLRITGRENPKFSDMKIFSGKGANEVVSSSFIK